MRDVRSSGSTCTGAARCLVRMTEDGQTLETTRISNDPEYLRAVMAQGRAVPGGGAAGLLRLVLGGAPWPWLGASVHPAHPLGSGGAPTGRVRNDERDAVDLADLLRMGRLPEAWIAPLATRQLRELVRHRAKLVGLRSNLECEVHAVLAGAGVPVAMSDLFGVGGRALLTQLALPAAMRAKVNSALRIIDCRARPALADESALPGLRPVRARSGQVIVRWVEPLRRARGQSDARAAVSPPAPRWR